MDTNTDEGESELSPTASSFTLEQEELFQKRVEEKYDLFVDPDYVWWLKIHHPHLLPSSGGSQVSNSVAAHFSSATPQNPITGISHTESMNTPSVSSLREPPSTSKSQSTGMPYHNHKHCSQGF